MGATSLDLSQIKTDALSAASTFRTLIGLGNVNNTSDANKPISTATQAALDLKADDSDLASYLPLAGGTLTGALAGTTISVTGNISASNLMLNAYQWIGWGGTNLLTADPDIGLRLNNVAIQQVSWLGFGSSSDLRLERDAADTLAQRRSTNAQRFNLYGTYTDASNYRRFYISSTTAGAFTLGVEGLGTGANGNTLSINNGLFVTSNSGFVKIIDTATSAIGVGGAVILSSNSQFGQGDWVQLRAHKDIAFDGNVDHNFLIRCFNSAFGGLRDHTFFHHYGYVGINKTSSLSAMLDIVNRGASDVGIRVRLAASASASALEIQNSAGGVLASLSSAGGFTATAGTFNGELWANNTINFGSATSGNARINMTSQQYTPANIAINMPWGTGNQQGIYGSNGLVGFAGSGTSYFEVNSSGLRLASTRSIGLGGTIASPEVLLFSGGSNVLEQRNGVSAQTWRLYNAFTDASNYDRGFIRWNSNVFEIGTERLGSYVTGRPLAFVVDGVERARITAAGNFGYNTTAPAGPFDVRFLRTGVAGPDLTAGQTFSASSTYPGYVVANIFDDVLATVDGSCWGSNTINTNQWVRVQFSTPRVIGQITVYNGHPQSANRGARRCELQGSNDGTNWTKIPAVSVSNGPAIINIDEFELANNFTNRQVVQFNNSTAYSSYRLFMYTSWGNAFLGLREVEMMETGISVADPRIFSGQNIGLGTTSPTAFISIAPTAFDTGSPVGFDFTGAAHTTLTASTEASDVNWNLARTVQFSSGALATQRAFRIQAPTYSFTGASTITTAATLSISGNPIAGTNATITNPFALILESGRLGLFGPGTNEIFIASDASNAPGALRLRNRTVLFGDAGNGGWITSGGQNTEPGNLAFGFGETAGSNWIAGLTNRGWVFVGANTPVYFGSAEISNPSGVAIVCPSSHVWEQRWTTNSQTWRLYNSFSDPGNFIRQVQSFTTYSTVVHAQWLAEGLGTGAVNIPMVISPRGTGAFILGPMPDGTSTGGNARGNYAIDLQSNLRSSATQVASGLYAVAIGTRNQANGEDAVAIGLDNIAGGYDTVCIGKINNAGFGGVSIGWANSASLTGISIGQGNSANGDTATGIGSLNTASGQYSTAIGRSNTAASLNSVAIGNNARSDRLGMFSHACGTINANGDAQFARFVARRKTTDAVATTLMLDGSSTRLTIPSGKLFLFTAKIVGVKSDGTSRASYIRKGTIINVAGATSIVGSIETIGTDVEDDPNLNLTITANDTNDALDIQVTGITGETWRWVAVVEGVEVAYGA